MISKLMLYNVSGVVANFLIIYTLTRLIHYRPEEINERQTFGHWECDLMIFQRGIQANLITLRERKTRFIIAIKNANKTAQGTALNLISTVKTLKKYIKSPTFDQGSEFHKYPWIRDCLEAVMKKILSHSQEMDAGDIIKYDKKDDEYYETSAYEDFLQATFIQPYDTETFW